jgi:hypothetical protein
MKNAGGVDSVHAAHARQHLRYERFFAVIAWNQFRR